MIQTDLHMHTTFSDGRDTPEDMILSAIQKGLTIVGISDHSWTFFDESYCMPKEKYEEYKNLLHGLREKYAGKIDVRCGIEQDYYSTLTPCGFDHVIGSVHYICVKDAAGADIYIPIDDSPEVLKEAADSFFGGDMISLAEYYFSIVSDVLEKTGADIIGHFDLISKFNEGDGLFDSSDERYRAAWKKAVLNLLKYDKPFEINTGAISRGYRTAPYPSAEMTAFIKGNGGRFVLSSDAHAKENIAYLFDKLTI